MQISSGVRKGLAWIALIGVICYEAIVMSMKGINWVCFIPVFFVFMSVFCELVSLYIQKYNKYVSRKLNNISLLLGICFVISLIIVAIVLA